MVHSELQVTSPPPTPTPPPVYLSPSMSFSQFTNPPTIQEPSPSYLANTRMEYIQPEMFQPTRVSRTFEDMGIPNPGALKDDGICDIWFLRPLWLAGSWSSQSYRSIRSMRVRVKFVGVKEVMLRVPVWKLDVSYAPEQTRLP